MATVRLFDNGGKTFDRYTAIFYAASGEQVGYRGMSEHPSHPQGFGQWGEGDVSGVLERDREIDVATAPDDVRRCIAQDLREIDAAYNNCPECGLPMSKVDDPTVADAPYWYCDGPNDSTDRTGCGHTFGMRLGG